jgi:hypothetical protein
MLAPTQPFLFRITEESNDQDGAGQLIDLDLRLSAAMIWHIGRLDEMDQF